MSSSTLVVSRPGFVVTRTSLRGQAPSCSPTVAFPRVPEAYAKPYTRSAINTRHACWVPAPWSWPDRPWPGSTCRLERTREPGSAVRPPYCPPCQRDGESRPRPPTLGSAAAPTPCTPRSTHHLFTARHHIPASRAVPNIPIGEKPRTLILNPQGGDRRSDRSDAPRRGGRHRDGRHLRGDLDGLYAALGVPFLPNPGAPPRSCRRLGPPSPPVRRGADTRSLPSQDCR